jgi:hypothetical protein
VAVSAAATVLTVLTALAFIPVALFVPSVMVTAVLVMSLPFFVMPVLIVGPLSCDINPATAFDVVGTAGIDLDVHSRRCRKVAIYVHVHTGARQPRRDEDTRDPCFGVIGGEGEYGS